ncbi:MAG: glutamate racemase [Candidatus Hydrogenedentes bacterium]|nr:glutamate racemase [Candidatus Hydrogenedentota bacterium]
MNNKTGTIGVFDSGVGGLTVFHRIAERLPGAAIIYLGDTARVPYGTKSAETVVRYARGCAGILLDRGISALVVACNTASAYALDTLRQEIAVPVLGVIEPGAQRAVQATRNGKVGVIGTAGTIHSGAYQKTIRELAPAIRVFAKPCPFFVPLVEEGWTDGDVPRRVVRTYLEELLDENIDTLVLGCTHYPLLKPVISEVAGADVALVDSAEATAHALVDLLHHESWERGTASKPCHRFLVTDAPENFARVSRRFLGYDVTDVEWVDF